MTTTVTTTVSPIVATFTRNLISLDKKVTMFTARAVSCDNEIAANDATYEEGKALFAGDDNKALVEMLASGHEAQGKALKLKRAKLDISLDDVVQERAVIAAELAKYDPPSAELEQAREEAPTSERG